MATPYERVKAAWDSPERAAQLNLAVEALAAEGVWREQLDEALIRLLNEVRSAGADDETEEIINGVGDRLHGWCAPEWHIRTATPPAPGVPPVQPSQG